MRFVLPFIVLCLAAAPLHAQDSTLSVLRHTPSDTASPGNVITVTFDRPVAGRLDATIEAARIFRLEPAIKGTVEWRDPVTIRFIPDEPLTPGTDVLVVIDTTFRAIDGSKLAQPYRFSFRVPGPRLLAQTSHGEYSSAPGVLPPDGKVRVLFSAPIDLARFALDARVELPACEGRARRIAMRPVRQRPPAKDDPYYFQYAGGYDRDTVGDRFRRVVELEPAEALPPDCAGRLVLPTTADDARHGAEESFAVKTSPLFRLAMLECSDWGNCAVDELLIKFTAPVKREDVQRYVHLQPKMPLNLVDQPSSSTQWRVKLHFPPRFRYALVVDSALRDVYGRSLVGRRRVALATGDYRPAIGFARGAVTVPRTGSRTIPLRHVNVQGVRIVSFIIPEPLRAMVLAAPPWRDMKRLQSLAGAPETTMVALPSTFNVQRTTEIPLPARLASAGTGLAAVRIEIANDYVGPDVKPRRTGLRAPVVVRAIGGIDPYAPLFTLVQLTDLAVHAKVGPGESTVFVTGLADGRPRAGATVRQLNAEGNVVAEGRTEADGVATLRTPSTPSSAASVRQRPISNIPQSSTTLIEATLDGDRVVGVHSMRRIGYGPYEPFEPWQLGGRAGDVPTVAATLFADRGIYRPGEMLYLKGILRRGILGALTTPAANDSVRLTLTHRANGWSSDEDIVVHDTVLRTTEFGTVADSLRLRPGLQLGNYVAELEIGGRTIASEMVRLAEYRAPEFLVDTRADSAPRYGGDTVTVHVAARYLFGAPMGSAHASWGAVLHEVGPWELHIPGAEGWTVGEWDWWSGDRDVAPPKQIGGESTLDASGRAEIAVPIAGLRPTRPARADISVAVTDVNRQAVTSSVSVPVHPARVYVLARKQSREWYWTVGQRATVEIRTVSPEGAGVPNVPVVVALVRRDWSAESGGQLVETPLRIDTVRTGARPVPYSFVPKQGGLYDLRLKAADGRGGIARTTVSAYVLGGGSGWRSTSPYHLPLVAEKQALAVGDSTTVLFDSPFDSAEAWITVEREGVLERRRMIVRRGPNAVPLRITSAHVPNVFVSVVLVRRALAEKLSRPDSAMQLLRIGYAELHVKTDTRRLTVAVEPQALEYGPGDSASLRLRVSDAAGRGARSEVALWAVDDGVLALTGYRTPDVLAAIYRPRALGARFSSTLGAMMTSNPELVLQLGETVVLRSATSAVAALRMDVPMPHAADAMSPVSMRRQFRSTAFYLATARTDDQGRAELRAKLPDNLTTYRVMAVAVGADDRLGSGDTTLLVTRALVARPTLPRFVRASDTLLAGAAVNVRDGRARTVNVEAASDGMTLQGERRRAITLEEGKGAEARFGFGVPSRDSVRDTVVVRLRASDGALGDAVETKLPVQPDFHRRTHTRIGVMRGATDVELELPSGTDAARSRLSLRVGTSPLVPMLAAYEWLRVYPYECTEQITSGGRALIAVWRATRDRDPNALGGDPRPKLQELADAIVRRQRGDGAIRYWNDDEWTSPWLTAYAGLFLLEAREQGVTVDSTVLGRVGGYLEGRMASLIDTSGMNRYERRSRRLGLGNRVAIVDYLRRFGHPNVKAEDALLNFTSVMTWEDRLRLAEVLSSRTEVREPVRAIVDAAWREVTVVGNRVDLPDSSHIAEREFASRVAPAARLLTATLALRPEQPLLGGLLETVLQQGRAEGRWAWNTQDYASVVLALSALSNDARQPRDVRVVGHGRTLLAGRFGATDSVVSVPLGGLLESGANGKAMLRLRLDPSRGAEPMYYAVSVDEVPSKAPVTPDIQGMVVERWYERFDDGRPVTSVREGDIVRVRLRVTVPAERQFVAVEDPLPAGLEPVDLSLRTSGTLQPFAASISDAARARAGSEPSGPTWQSWLYGRWEDGGWSPWEHKSLHDDKVVYFARVLWAGTYTASYVARATTAGSFVRPPAHAEEMYNPALQGRSDGGRFEIVEKKP